MFALLINASILILAAATFHKTGNTDVAELGQAQALLHPLLGSAIAPTLFGIALLCCGLNSTVTATLAGQAVMEGFLDIRLPPWLRRLVTRAIAIIPAAGVTIFYGEQETGKLLILTPGDAEPAAALRRRAAGAVHRRAAPRWARWWRRNGWSPSPSLIAASTHRPQYQAALGPGRRRLFLEGAPAPSAGRGRHGCTSRDAPPTCAGAHPAMQSRGS